MKGELIESTEPSGNHNQDEAKMTAKSNSHRSINDMVDESRMNFGWLISYEKRGVYLYVIIYRST